jgi:hypothetical protein
LLLVQPSLLKLYVWDVAAKQVRDSLIGIAVMSRLSASADGSVIAAMDGTLVQFWRGTREPSSRFRWKNGAAPRAFTISGNGQLFAYDYAGKVTIGDVARGDIIGEMETSQGAAASLVFSPDDTELIAVSTDGRVTRIATNADAWMKRACAIASGREGVSRFGVYGPGAKIAPPRRCQPAPASR